MALFRNSSPGALTMQQAIALEKKRLAERRRQKQRARALAAQGRGADTEIAHVARGEFVVPEALQTPEVMAVLGRAAAVAGIPLERLCIGSSANSINPKTGVPEFGFGDWLSQLRNRFFGSENSDGAIIDGPTPSATAAPVPSIPAPSIDRNIYAEDGTIYAQRPDWEEMRQQAAEKVNAPFRNQVAKNTGYISNLLDPRVEAGMRAMSRAEGGAVNKWTGGRQFKPSINHPGYNPDNGQSAAGLYQMQTTTFDDMQKIIGPVNFEEPGQKLSSAALLDHLHALDPLREGDFDGFLKRASRRWAALPEGPGEFDRTNRVLSEKNTAKPYSSVRAWYEEYLKQQGR